MVSDLAVLVHDDQREAGVNPLAIHEHGAGAAQVVVVAFLGTGKVEVFAQGIEQGGPGRELVGAFLAVDAQRDGLGGRQRAWPVVPPGLPGYGEPRQKHVVR